MGESCEGVSSSIRMTSYPMRPEERFFSLRSFRPVSLGRIPGRPSLSRLDWACCEAVCAFPVRGFVAGECAPLRLVEAAACCMDSIPVPPTCEVSAEAPGVVVTREETPETDDRAAAPIPALVPSPSMPPRAAVECRLCSEPGPVEFSHSAVELWRRRSMRACGSRGR